MNHDQARDLIHDYVDNDLKANDREQLEQHLDDCRECRDEVAYLRGLLQRAAGLQRPVTPPHDLWPGIATAIERDEVPGVTAATSDAAAGSAGRDYVRRRILSLPLAPARLAAAAVAVGILLTASVLWRIGPEFARLAPVEPSVTASRLADVPIDFGVTEASATAEALAAVTRPDTRERLAFATLTGQRTFAPGHKALGFGIAQFDQAIAELESAWLADPSNTRLAHQLATAYQNRALLQRRADRLIVQL